QVGDAGGGAVRLPGVDDAPFHVDEMSLRRIQGRDQGVALEGACLVDRYAGLTGLGGLPPLGRLPEGPDRDAQPQYQDKSAEETAWCHTMPPESSILHPPPNK